MDWNTLLSAFVGGIFGGGIAGAAAFVQLRRDRVQALQARRWVDAEVVADAKSLLMELDPQRRTINVNRTPGGEAALWKDLDHRRDQLYRQLLMLAAGHPSHEVATAANELGLALLWTAHHSQFAVSQILADRISSKSIEVAQEKHTAADAAAESLAIAIKKAAISQRRSLIKPSKRSNQAEHKQTS